MTFNSASQLKAWVKNKAVKTETPANTILQSYMMERFLERVSASQYRKNFILKGGLLIASMVGVDKRSTMDIDTTVKGISVSRTEIENILREILATNINDNTGFEIKSINPIHDVSDYDDFRVGLLAILDTVRVDMKIDITTGDIIVPREIEYQYNLMFEDRTIPLMAYNLYTILAEKIETILSRNVFNTRGRNFYDVYILLTLNKETLSRPTLLDALYSKAEERGSLPAIDSHAKHLSDIAVSPEIANIWDAYVRRYPYAKGISMDVIINLIAWIFALDGQIDNN
ncbi:MAG: nucleotidyl transferase AbiEii/AbiGii toxin family protein [Clostridiales Family XIII bacterium]|jgi:predicted nucleotidyltransferase component of viral defense system|nr:nucleotidyl transferase AbiEii/AbiGii toxin family protein [Clostridiales Family XIII bacterium]